jgi:O-antigen ligase
LGLILRPLQFVTAIPTFLFLATLTTMLLWHTEAPLYRVSRFAFGIVIVGVVGRAVIFRRRLFVIERISWPMIGLTLMVLASLLVRPFDREAWGVFATKYLIPFAMFHLAGLVFTSEKPLRRFEMFALVVFSYLSFTAIAFLVGAHALVFPRFILDSSLGYHTERARGPFLQAVANGVSLNMLGLLAVHAYQRGSMRGVKAALLLGSVPIAILATMTRAVWLSFAGTLAALIVLSGNRALRRAGFALIVIAGVGLALVLSSPDLNRALTDRATESQPVEFRQDVYAGGWQMFLDRPLLGWGFHQMPLQLPTYVSGHRDKVLYPHNTYLEILVENGLVGLALYLWLMSEMWQLRQAPIPPGESGGFLDRGFHRIWPILLAVYWVNAAVVVMSYQFVNALLFTMAGMLAAQRQRAERANAC